MNYATFLDNSIKHLQTLRLEFPPEPQEGSGFPRSQDGPSCRVLDEIAQNLVWLSEYMTWRGAAGCGDHGDAKALKKANRMKIKVRKALGYAYP